MNTTDLLRLCFTISLTLRPVTTTQVQIYWNTRVWGKKRGGSRTKSGISSGWTSWRKFGSRDRRIWIGIWGVLSWIIWHRPIWAIVSCWEISRMRIRADLRREGTMRRGSNRKRKKGSRCRSRGDCSRKRGRGKRNRPEKKRNWSCRWKGRNRGKLKRIKKGSKMR